MADSPRDNNHIPAILLESSTSPGTVITAKGDQITGRLLVDIASATGTVTSVSVVTANGFAGTVATATTTPAITISTTITGLIKGNGTAISAATAGTDYTALAFKTISVSGQSDVVADTAADTLTLVASSNISITTNAGTDTITIAATGLATVALDNLASVAINAALVLGTSDAFALGSTTKMWADLFLASGGVINWNNGNVLLTHIAATLSLTANYFQFGNTFYAVSSYPSGTNSYIIVDKAATAADSSLVLRDQGNARAEIGLVGDNNIRFKTVSGSYPTETFTDRMMINATSGNVAIGNTSSPDALLHVYANSGTPGIFLGEVGAARHNLEFYYDFSNDKSIIQSIHRGTAYKILEIDTSELEVFTGTGSTTQHFTVTSDGRLYGSALHNNGGAVTGPTNQYLASGTYTPTRSAEVNMDGNVTTLQAQWMRVGNVVTVSGRFTADPTTATLATSFEITLPIASNLGAAEDAAGTAFCGNIVSMGAEIIGVAANDTAKIQWKASDVTSQTWSYTFTYEII